LEKYVTIAPAPSKNAGFTPHDIFVTVRSSPRAEAAARDLAEYRRHADKTFEEAAQ